MDETGRLVAVVLLASFAIERVVAVVDFFMSRIDPEEKRRKYVLVGIAALIALAVVYLSGIRILAAMKFAAPNRWIDFALTWLILVGGADKLGQLFGGGGGQQGTMSTQTSQNVPPIQIYLDQKDVTADVTSRR
jgi:hypothetical protein